MIRYRASDNVAALRSLPPDEQERLARLLAGEQEDDDREENMKREQKRRHDTWIWRELDERGWSARYLGRLLGISYTHAARLAKEEQPLTVEMCKRLATVFAMTRAWGRVRGRMWTSALRTASMFRLKALQINTSTSFFKNFGQYPTADLHGSPITPTQAHGTGPFKFPRYSLQSRVIGSPCRPSAASFRASVYFPAGHRAQCVGLALHLGQYSPDYLLNPLW